VTQTELPIRHIFRWDLDKTYLRTEFDTVRDLIRTALQKPEEKINVPGVVTLLKELTRPTDEGRAVVTFISGSPTQMRAKLERKFEIDGITPDIFILKPTLQNILKGRFKAVRGQVGYKLDTLLRVRAQSPPAPETLFGDDAEQDAFIYSLYADIAAGLIDETLLREILAEAHVYPATQQSILERFAGLEQGGQVGRIFIHLDRYTAPGRFWVYGPRVVPITNYFQTALVLYADGVLEAASVVRVAAGMISGANYGIYDLANSFQDLARRRHLDLSTIERLAQEIPNAAEEATVPPQFMERLLSRVRALAPASDRGVARTWQGPPDYIEVLRADRKLREMIKEEGRGSGLFS
jgi:hypothetical protein